MSLTLALVAVIIAAWGFMAFAIAESHPTPSQTSLIAQFLFCFVAAPVAAVAAFVTWLFGG